MRPACQRGVLALERLEAGSEARRCRSRDRPGERILANAIGRRRLNHAGILVLQHDLGARHGGDASRTTPRTVPWYPERRSRRPATGRGWQRAPTPPCCASWRCLGGHSTASTVANRWGFLARGHQVRRSVSAEHAVGRRLDARRAGARSPRGGPNSHRRQSMPPRRPPARRSARRASEATGSGEDISRCRRSTRRPGSTTSSNASCTARARSSSGVPVKRWRRSDAAASTACRCHGASAGDAGAASTSRRRGPCHRRLLAAMEPGEQVREVGLVVGAVPERCAHADAVGPDCTVEGRARSPRRSPARVGAPERRSTP